MRCRRRACVTRPWQQDIASRLCCAGREGMLPHELLLLLLLALVMRGVEAALLVRARDDVLTLFRVSGAFAGGVLLLRKRRKLGEEGETGETADAGWEGEVLVSWATTSGSTTMLRADSGVLTSSSSSVDSERLLRDVGFALTGR